MQQATDAYLKKEREVNSNSGEDVVLVSADSIQSLKQAYPNYFFDTRDLVTQVSALVGRKKSDRK